MDEEADAPPADTGNPHAEDIAKLHAEFRTRLLLADLRAEAIKAGMVDLDGLKLFDVSALHLGDDDRVVDGAKIMDAFRSRKPWLFGSGSSPGPAVAPEPRPVRHKTAMDMSDAEYAAARTAVTRQQH